jgi:uncharacterized membrane protein YhaH (DUF805 family)
MYKECVPYKRKALYLLLTIPIVVLYLLIIKHLWQVNKLVFVIYCSFFVMIIPFQSYCCAYQSCPYMGKFCPGVGGFIIPASVIGLLLNKVRKSKKLFNLFASMGSLCLFTIILFPVYFIYKIGINFLIFYLIIVMIYSVLFLLFICPVCATRETCPAGKVSSNLSEKLKT